MANNLAITVTADIAELEVKFRIAQAEARSLSNELNRLASASSKGIVDPSASAQLAGVAARMLEARQTASALSGQIQASGVAVGGFGRISEMSGREVAMSARHFHSLFDELRAGNAAGAEVSVLRLAASVLRLGPAALGAVAGVAALAAGVGYLIARAIEASHALDQMEIAAKVAGNNLPRAELQQFTQDLAQAGNVTQAQAEKIVAALAHIPGMAAPSLQTAESLVSRFALAIGTDAEKANAELIKIFKAPSADAAVRMLRDLNLEVSGLQENEARAADAQGSLGAAEAAKWQLIQQSVSSANAEEAKEAASWSASWKNKTRIISDFLDHRARGLTMEQAEAARIAEQTALFAQQNEVVQANTAARAAQANTGGQNLKIGIEFVSKEPPITAQIREAEMEAHKLEAALAAAVEKLGRMDSSALDPAVIKAAANDVADLNAKLTETRQKANDLQFGPVLDRMREQMQQLAATNEGTQSQLLSRQIAVAQTALTQVTGSAKETLAVKTELARLEVQYRTATDEQILASTRRTNTEIQGDTTRTTAQRLEAERSLWQQTLTEVHAGSAAYKEAQQEVASFSTQIARQAAEAQRTIEQQNVETQIAIGHTRIDAEKSVLEEELAAHQITATQKLAVLTALTQQETDLDIKGLQARLAVAGLEPAERNRINNQILELRAKLNADLAALDRQAAEDARRAARDQATAWKDAVSEIEGAETGLISSVLSRRKTLGQALYQEASKVADQEIESFVRAETTRALLGDKDKALEQGGLLYHLFTENEKTTASQAGAAARANADTLEASRATVTDQSQVLSYGAAQAQMTSATASGTATRTGIQQSSSGGFFSLIAQMLAKWFGHETAKTAATGAAAAQRTTLQSTADAEAATATSIAAASQISADAGVAAAGAAASVAAIPVVGWAMAPGVAAETFGMVMAYQGAAALAKGAWEVPRDMPANIHAGEMVIPASHAEALRGAVSQAEGFAGLGTAVASAGASRAAASGLDDAVGSMARLGESEAPAGKEAARVIGGGGAVVEPPPVRMEQLTGLTAPTAESQGLVKAAEQMGSGATVNERVAAFSDLTKAVALHHFETGAWEVPADALAQIHAGEMVVPAAQAEVLRSAVGAPDDAGAKAMVRAAVGGGGSAAAAAAAAAPPAVPTPTPIGVAPRDREAAAGATTVPGSGGIDYADLGDADAGVPPAEVPALGYKKVGVSQGGMVYQPGALGFGEKTMFLPLGFLDAVFGTSIFAHFENWFNKLFGGVEPGTVPIVPTQPGAVTSAWGTVVGPAASQYGEAAAAAAATAAGGAGGAPVGGGHPVSDLAGAREIAGAAGTASAPPAVPAASFGSIAAAPSATAISGLTPIAGNEILPEGTSLSALVENVLGRAGKLPDTSQAVAPSTGAFLDRVLAAGPGGGAFQEALYGLAVKEAQAGAIAGIQTQAAEAQRTALAAQQGAVVGAGLGGDLSRVVSHASTVNLGAWRVPLGASPAAAAPETGARPTATLLASEAAAAREAPQAGDTFGDVNFHGIHMHGVTNVDDFARTVQKMIRNAHPAALKALRR